MNECTVHLVRFTIEIYHDARSYKRQTENIPVYNIKSPSIHPSIYATTAPSGPWSPSQDASIRLYSQLFSSILLSPAVVVHPSELHPPI